MSLDVCEFGGRGVGFALGVIVFNYFKTSIESLGNLLVSARNENFSSFFPHISTEFLQKFHEDGFLSYNIIKADLPCSYDLNAAMGSYVLFRKGELVELLCM